MNIEDIDLSIKELHEFAMPVELEFIRKFPRFRLSNAFKYYLKHELAEHFTVETMKSIMKRATERTETPIWCTRYFKNACIARIEIGETDYESNDVVVEPYRQTAA